MDRYIATYNNDLERFAQNMARCIIERLGNRVPSEKVTETQNIIQQIGVEAGKQLQAETEGLMGG